MADMHITPDDVVEDFAIPPISLGDSQQQINEKLFYIGQAASKAISSSVKIIDELKNTQTAADGQYQENLTSIQALSLEISGNDLELSQLQQDIANINLTIDDATGDITANNTQIQQLITDLDTAESDIAANISTINSINITVSGHSDDIANLQTSVNANIQNINTINIDVGDLETTVNAINGVTLNVNGFVTGFVQTNDGTTGDFNILADKFSLIRPTDNAIMLQYDATEASLDVVGKARFLNQVIGYANILDRPTDLSDINSSEGSKLAGMEAGAQVNRTETIWTRTYSVNASNKLPLKMPDGTTDLVGRPPGTSNAKSKYVVQIVTLYTGTVTGYAAEVAFNGTSFDITVIYQEGSSSNHPRLEVSGSQVLVSTYHANLYNLSVTVNDVTLGNPATYGAVASDVAEWESYADAVAIAEADLAETQANAYADGVVSVEEARAIADAESKYRQAIIDGGSDNLFSFAEAEDNDILGWSTGNTFAGDNLESAASTAHTVVSTGSEGGNAVRIVGSNWLYCQRRFPVNTAKTYRVRFRVRQTVDPSSGGAKVYAGVVTYGADGTILTGGPGTHRYCAVAGVTITVADGWKVYEGIIAGEGNDTHNQFRFGTAFVSPMLIVNYSGGNGTAEVDYCSFTLDEIDTRNIEDNANAADFNTLTQPSNNLVPNGFGYLKALDGRPAGVKPAYSNNQISTISFLDESLGQVKLYSGTDNQIGMCWPAFRLEANTKYRIRIRVKASAAASSGFYFRMQEYDAELPVGKTHVCNEAGGFAGIQEDTRQKTGFAENLAVSTSWTEYEWSYTPTSSARWSSPSMLNWSGMGYAELHVDYVVITPIINSDADNTSSVLTSKGIEDGAQVNNANVARIGCTINSATYGGSEGSNNGEIYIYGYTTKGVMEPTPRIWWNGNLITLQTSSARTNPNQAVGKCYIIYTFNTTGYSGASGYQYYNATKSAEGWRIYWGDGTTGNRLLTPAEEDECIVIGTANVDGSESVKSAAVWQVAQSLDEVPALDADNTVDNLNTTLDVSGTIRGINIEAESFRTNVPDLTFYETTVGGSVKLTETNEITINDASWQGYNFINGLENVINIDKTGTGAYQETLVKNFGYAVDVRQSKDGVFGEIVEARWFSDSPMQIKTILTALSGSVTSPSYMNYAMAIDIDDTDFTGVQGTPFVDGLQVRFDPAANPYETNGINVQNLASSNRNNGISSTASNAVTNYGGEFVGSGGTTAYGIYASAYGATTNWAGWFAGNVNITGELQRAGIKIIDYGSNSNGSWVRMVDADGTKIQICWGQFGNYNGGTGTQSKGYPAAFSSTPTPVATPYFTGTYTYRAGLIIRSSTTFQIYWGGSGNPSVGTSWMAIGNWS